MLKHLFEKLLFMHQGYVYADYSYSEMGIYRDNLLAIIFY